MNLRSGDIIFTKGAGWSSMWRIVFRGSGWTHVAMYLGRGKTIEMTYKGLRTVTLKKRYVGKYVGIARFNMDKRTRSWFTNEFKTKIWLDLQAYPFHLCKFDKLRLILPFLPKRNGHYLCDEYLQKYINVDYAKLGRGLWNSDLSRQPFKLIFKGRLK